MKVFCLYNWLHYRFSVLIQCDFFLLLLKKLYFSKYAFFCVPQWQWYRSWVPNLQDLMLDALRWRWCNINRNKVYNKCNALESSPKHAPQACSMEKLTLLHGKVALHKTGPWCHSGWDLLAIDHVGLSTFTEWKNAHSWSIAFFYQVFSKTQAQYFRRFGHKGKLYLALAYPMKKTTTLQVNEFKTLFI